MAFDKEFYLSACPDVVAAGWDPLEHYCVAGWLEGRDPAPWFSTTYYLETHEDVLAAGCEPFSHYLSLGRHENRQICDADAVAVATYRRHLALVHGEFDPAFYRAANPQLNLTPLGPAMHFLLRGWRQNRDPAPWFSVAYYLAAYPDVRAAGLNPFVHFLQWGRAEGRQADRRIRNSVEPFFDSPHYMRQNPPVGGLEPIEHYLAFGWREGLNPSKDFSINHYLRLYPDVAEAGLNPLHHYVTHGQHEGRSVQPSTARRQSAMPGAPAILFVGHDGRQAGSQVVLLEVVRWVADHTRCPIKVLLLLPGPMAADYAEYAEIFVMAREPGTYLGDPSFLEFVKGPTVAVYVNTAAAAHFWMLYDRFFAAARIPAILHIHELYNVLMEFESDFRAMEQRSSSVVAVSEAVRRVLVDEIGCPSDKLTLSNAFIRTHVNHLHEIGPARVAARAALDIPEDLFVVVGCGSVDRRKGADLFLEVAQKADAGFGTSLMFIWIGDGPELGDLRTAVIASGLQDSVRFVGFQKAAARLVAAADVFFLPSREDPFPLVCLEAAQYGIPTVYFAGRTGISECIGTDAGCALPALDTGAACRTIRMLSAQPGLRQQMGSIAHSRLMTRYTAEIGARQLAFHLLNLADKAPHISVVVPTYNQAQFIRERLDSILQQTVQDFEVLVLDDCSTDETAAIVGQYLADPRIRLIRNDVNSASPFKQWKKGISHCRSDLVWIAEGDDACGNDFLETLLPAFDEPTTAIAFCRSEVIDECSAIRCGSLDEYLSQSGFPFHEMSVRMEGIRAVDAGFGALCLIVNASSAIVRKACVADCLDAAEQFRMCGDWYFYLAALRHGELFYTRAAVSYFRRHTNSVVHRLEGSLTYFQERSRVLQFVTDSFAISQRTARTMLAIMKNEVLRFSNRIESHDGKPLYDSNRITARLQALSRRPRLRVGFYVHGLLFSRGGIERICAELANELVRRGHDVVVFCRVWDGAQPVYRLSPSVELVPVFDESRVRCIDRSYASGRDQA